jgi:hypothetical protein
MALETYIKWIEAHERLLLAAVAGLVLWFGIGKIDTLIIHHDQAQLAQATEASKVQAEKDAATATLALQEREQYKALAQQVATQNEALEQANATLTAALSQRQKTDASLPPSELVNRWATLVPQAKPTVTPSGVALDSAGAVATVQELEKVPVLSSQIENEHTQLENAQKLVASEGTQITTLNTLVTGKDAELADNAKVCATQIATVKAEARKSKMHWFEAGYVAGLVTRGVITILTGH